MADAAKPRWFHLTPDRVVLVLLAVEGLLGLAERLGWLAKGWPVLAAIATITAALGLMFAWFLLALVFRGRFQFGIRSLLLLTLVVAIACSWLSTEMKQARQQRTAVEAVAEAGGRVTYDYQRTADDTVSQPRAAPWLRKRLGDDLFVSVTAIDFARAGVSDDGLDCIAGFNRFQRLVLTGTWISDAGLRRLEGLTRLEALYLGRTNISDAGLDHLKGLTRLRALDLFHTRIGDAGLQKIEGFSRLRFLGLDWTKVADAGLEHLKGLARLEVLYLGYTKVTDAGLQHLEALKRLREVELYGTAVTAAGVAKLRRTLPNCTIYR
jgi:hypothetical protein